MNDLFNKAGMGHQRHCHMELVCLMGDGKRLFFSWLSDNMSINYSCISRWPTALPQYPLPLISLLFIITKRANSAAKYFCFIREETSSSQFTNVQVPRYMV